MKARDRYRSSRTENASDDLDRSKPVRSKPVRSKPVRSKPVRSKPVKSYTHLGIDISASGLYAHTQSH
jgi:hypothetical protein